MDLCRIFTSAVLAGAPVLPYQDSLLAAVPLTAARLWPRAGCVPSFLLLWERNLCQRKPSLACEKPTSSYKEGTALSGDRIEEFPNLAAQSSDALGHHFPFHKRDSFCFSQHCTFETYVRNHCKLLCAFRPSLK